VIKARTRGAELYESLSFRLAIYQWGLAVARRHIQSALALCRPGGLFLISTEIGYLIDWLLPPDLSVESFMRDLEAWTRSAPPHPLPVSIARLVVPEDQHLRAVQRASMSELDYSGSEFRLDMTPPAFTMAELGAQIVIQRLMTVLTADGDRSVFSVTLARKPLPKTGA
jgi:hypothetical protein